MVDHRTRRQQDLFAGGSPVLDELGWEECFYAFPHLRPGSFHVLSGFVRYPRATLAFLFFLSHSNLPSGEPTLFYYSESVNS
jgi:hypothetical protein